MRQIRFATVFCTMMILLTGCRFGNQSFATFVPLSEGQVSSRCFVPTKMEYTEVDGQLPANTYLPDGSTVTEFLTRGETDILDSTEVAGAPSRTTSTNPPAMIQELASWGFQKSLVQIAGVYQSINSDGEPLLLSGKVIMPADGKFRRYILVSHYTIGSNREAPYNCFSLEGLLAKMGYAVILPDYLGYGITADSIHPYLMMDLTARHVIDMYFAVNEYMQAQDIRPDYEDIYLMGYSQGGATTMAVERYIEEYLPESSIRIRRVFAGGGPYDVRATYQSFVSTNVASYPVAVPMVVQGMIHGAHLNITCEQMLSERVYKDLDRLINSKQYTTGEINRALGTKQTDLLLSPTSLDVTSAEVAELYKAMTENSIISYSWTPEAPVYIMHSINDETVPYENATLAETKWRNANIQYNFGYYGTHVKTAIRFVMAVGGLLKTEQEMEDRVL